MLQSEKVEKLQHTLHPKQVLRDNDKRDIIKKGGNRKQRYLISFPGLLQPLKNGGKMGTLDKMDTSNPVLYIEFPIGRIKCVGKMVHSSTKYLAMQFTKKGKQVVCQDIFQHIIVFDKVFFVGKPESNPKEDAMEMPDELYQDADGDEVAFDHGAGTMVDPVKEVSSRKRKIEHLKNSVIAFSESDDSDDSPVETKKRNASIVLPSTKQAPCISPQRARMSKAKVISYKVDESEDSEDSDNEDSYSETDE